MFDDEGFSLSDINETVATKSDDDMYFLEPEEAHVCVGKCDGQCEHALSMEEEVDLEKAKVHMYVN